MAEQFGWPTGELKAAMRYFVQVYGCRKTAPDKYDMLMDIATEGFIHFEIVGDTIHMMLRAVNGELKNVAGKSGLTTELDGKSDKENKQKGNYKFFIYNQLTKKKKWKTKTQSQKVLQMAHVKQIQARKAQCNLRS